MLWDGWSPYSDWSDVVSTLRQGSLGYIDFIHFNFMWPHLAHQSKWISLNWIIDHKWALVCLWTSWMHELMSYASYEPERGHVIVVFCKVSPQRWCMVFSLFHHGIMIGVLLIFSNGNMFGVLYIFSKDAMDQEAKSQGGVMNVTHLGAHCGADRTTRKCPTNVGHMQKVLRTSHNTWGSCIHIGSVTKKSRNWSTLLKHGVPDCRSTPQKDSVRLYTLTLTLLF